MDAADNLRSVRTSEPIVFVSHFRVKEGRSGEMRHLSDQIARAMEEGRPRTLSFLFYVDESGTRMSILHVFPDANSMDLHFAGAQERSSAAYEYVDPEGWEIYGRPSKTVLAQMRHEAVSAGVTLEVQPEFVAGFIRLGSG
jgi:hypothetical protein